MVAFSVHSPCKEVNQNLKTKATVQTDTLNLRDAIYTNQEPGCWNEPRSESRSCFTSTAFTWAEAHPAAVLPPKRLSQTFHLLPRRQSTTADWIRAWLSVHTCTLRMSGVENSWVMKPNSGKIPCNFTYVALSFWGGARKDFFFKKRSWYWCAIFVQNTLLIIYDLISKKI